VLLDLMMPQMDGRTFRIEQLQDPALSPIPVVIVSAMTDVVEAAEELQVAAHVTKPVPLEDLVQIVDRFCPRA
jgi:CheY-like chemotaxis protein